MLSNRQAICKYVLVGFHKEDQMTKNPFVASNNNQIFLVQKCFNEKS